MDNKDIEQAVARGIRREKEQQANRVMTIIGWGVVAAVVMSVVAAIVSFVNNRPLPPPELRSPR